MKFVVGGSHSYFSTSSPFLSIAMFHLRLGACIPASKNSVDCSLSNFNLQFSLPHNWHNFCLLNLLLILPFLGGTRGAIVVVVGYRHGNETDYISHSTNTLVKGMNPIILPPAIGK